MFDHLLFQVAAWTWLPLRVTATLVHCSFHTSEEVEEYIRAASLKMGPSSPSTVSVFDLAREQVKLECQEILSDSLITTE